MIGVVVAVATLAARPIEVPDTRRTDPPWVGTYYAGEGLGFNASLTLARNAEFTFHQYGCEGTHALSSGPIDATAERIHLRTIVPISTRSMPGLSEDLGLVPWGDRRYLIPDGQLKEFCNAVNAGTEPRHHSRGDFLLRVGDETKPAVGMPALPCLLGVPIRTRIVHVGGARRDNERRGQPTLTRIRLAAGSAEGVWVGMAFGRHQPVPSLPSIKVLSVEEHSCEAEYEEFGSPEYQRPPQVGWEVTTRFDTFEDETR
jgi:hypothetical protein